MNVSDVKDGGLAVAKTDERSITVGVNQLVVAAGDAKPETLTGYCKTGAAISMTIDIAKGRYWDEGITLVDGCTPCSPGCEHCWRAAQSHRFNRKQYFTYANGRFNGDTQIHPERLKRFNTRKPKVFSIWNDLFHEAVPSQFINDAWNEMFNHSQNIYLCLTKRPAIMEKWLRMAAIVRHWPHDEICPDNIYLGLTVCNQQEAYEKLSDFKKIPGKKFLSLEPLLSDIPFLMLDGIDCVICGGESGPGARPMNPEWVRSVRNQCAAVGVPFFFKSWGKHLPGLKDCFGKEVVSPYSALAIDVKRLLDGRTHDELPWVKP